MLIEEKYRTFFNDNVESEVDKIVCYLTEDISISFIYDASFKRVCSVVYCIYSTTFTHRILRDLGIIINKQLERKEGLGDFKKLYVLAQNNRK